MCFFSGVILCGGLPRAPKPVGERPLEPSRKYWRQTIRRPKQTKTACFYRTTANSIEQILRRLEGRLFGVADPFFSSCQMYFWRKNFIGLTVILCVCAIFMKNHRLPQLFSIYYKVLDSLWTMKVTSLQFKMKKEWSASPFLVEFQLDKV